MSDREQLQQMTRHTSASTIRAAVAQAKQGSRAGRLQLTAAMAWVAYACPAATEAVCDNIAAAWLGHGPTPEVPDDLPEAPLEDSFWEAFWTVVDGHDEGYDAISITVAVAALGAAVHPRFGEISDQHAQEHPGSKNAIKNPVPGYTDIDPLASLPDGSLGKELHTLLIENGYDPEVLDRNAIALSELPHALEYVNTRILQMHEVWHLVAGYRTTGSHEIAISAFQLAQFPHNYSSMFLAAGMGIAHFKEPRTFTILMQIISEAWQHGRETPVMMDIEWEKEWAAQIEDIRERYNINPYESIFPDDLMESAGEASLLKKIRIGFQLLRWHRRLQKEPLAA
ncbi:MAG: hypothetical protein HKN19_12400 [Halioglobus sp.]|nr:hypothetical protein [Halioglobus sp.]